jgi:GTP-binding protein HflX
MPRAPQPVAPAHRRERAILVGVQLGRDGDLPVEETLEELLLLSDTAGADVVDSLVQNRSGPDPATFVGRGFVERISQRARALEADLVIFDDDLSPNQVRNLEQEIPAKVVDRSGLILDIFAERAKTREAMTQVELAQLEYLLPRLTRAWTHLSRQVGGIGTGRGPGETQLETDRRLIRRRIGELHRDLERIERQRQTQRAGRRDFFQATLVGYTNAGKSTLLNRLADADVFVEDRLFATLDATTRAVVLPGGPRMLLTDTVGFIRKLPAALIASFRSTLEEAVVADLLVHVVDLSHPWFEDHITSANRVLDELGILHHPTLMVFNKRDRTDAEAERRVRAAWPEAVVVSAATGTGIPDLETALVEYVRRQQVVLAVEVPAGRPDLINLLHESGRVLEESWQEGRVRLRLRTSATQADRLKTRCAEVEGLVWEQTAAAPPPAEVPTGV